MTEATTTLTCAGLRPAVDSRAVTEDIPVSGLEAGDVGVIIDYDLPACAGAPTILTRGGCATTDWQLL
jgi:hypothetical protein